jgi:hypothetical protein
VRKIEELIAADRALAGDIELPRRMLECDKSRLTHHRCQTARAEPEHL